MMPPALIVIDAQHTWTVKSPLTTARIESAVKSLRESMSIIWVYMNSDGPVHDFTSAKKGIVNKTFSRLTGGYKPTFYPDTRDFFGTKNHPNGFANTDLEDFLRDREMTDLYFAGFVGPQCVQVTAIAAAKKEFNASIITDLTCGFNDQASVFNVVPGESCIQVAESPYRVKLLTSKDMGLNLA